MDQTITYEQFFKRRILQNEALIKRLKTGIWLYYLLLIFEGALRKWVLPSLATPLLIIRDPIAIWILMVALSRGILKPNVYIVSIFVVSVISFFTAVTLGHGNVFVAFFGVRILLVHFPLMFVIGNVFDREDIESLGRTTLWISLFMVVLIGLQFFSPQTAWINRGVGGEGGGGFSGALGFFRPPGTFSFTNGTALFFGFAGMFIFYFLLQTKKISTGLLVSSIIALLASIPLSISRSLTFTLGFCVLFMLFTIALQPKHTGKVIYGIIGIVILAGIISQFDFFQTATEAFTERFTTATVSEGGLQGVVLDRYLGGMIGAIANSAQIPFFGYGIGMGTNVGAQLLTGKLIFLISEGEWGRLIGEMGLLFGLIVIFIRLAFCLQITQLAFKALIKNDVLPWMLLSFALLAIPQGQWAQPTSLGFSTLAGGLVLASLKKK